MKRFGGDGGKTVTVNSKFHVSMIRVFLTQYLHEQSFDTINGCVQQVEVNRLMDTLKE